MKHYFFIFLILSIALIVRLINFTDSFWLDEAAQAGESCRPLSEQFNIESDFQPPLYHLIVHGLCQFSQTEWWLRMASLIPGLITIYFTILIGKQLHSDHVGYLSGIILSLSQFHTFYSQELRPYSLATMFGVLSIWALIKYLNTPAPKFIILYSLLTGLGLYSTYVYWLLPLSVIIYLKLTKSIALKPLMIATFVGCLTFIPWMPTFLKQLSIGQSLATSNSVWKTSVSPQVLKSLPLSIAKLTLGRIPFDLNLSTAIITIVAFFSFGMILHRSRVQKPFSMLLALSSLPILFAFLISFFVPILDPKRVMFVLPYWTTLLALGINHSYKSIIALIVILNMSIFALIISTSNPIAGRENWRQVVSDIQVAYMPGDLVVQSFSEPFAPWAWYAKDTMRVIALSNPNLLSIRLAESQPNRLFIFDYLMDMTDPDRIIYQTVHKIGYQESIVHNYPLIGSVRLFTLPNQQITAYK